LANHNSHNHSYNIEPAKGRLFFTIVLNLVIAVAQIIGGIISGSLALISDALHNFSDAISIVISYIALKLRSKQNSYKHTFGLKRAEILAALLNSSTMIVVCLYLFYEAAVRFLEPREINPGIMTAVAIVGLIANLAAVLLLRKDSQESMNIRSAYLHLLGDTVSMEYQLDRSASYNYNWYLHNKREFFNFTGSNSCSNGRRAAAYFY